MPHDFHVIGSDPNAATRLASELVTALTHHGAPKRPVLFACIGTDRSTGDALGPLVGQWLVRSGCDPDTVLGTLEYPLHAVNLHDRTTHILSEDDRPIVVAIDAALGVHHEVGMISLHKVGLRPGHGVGKNLGQIGDVSITATVNAASGGIEAHVLQSTRLYIVQTLAKTIGIGCMHALRLIERPRGLDALEALMTA